MYSGAAEIEAVRELISGEEHFREWVEHPASSILHHDQRCCEEARLWFLAYARSMEAGPEAHGGIRAPTWLSKHFSWGPSKWPIAWCQLVEEDVVDCGVFAALAREVFTAQGHQAHPAQALLSFNPTCTEHWRGLWKKKDDVKTFPWIGNRVVYHELCVLELPGGEGRIYDSTWGAWYEARQRVGFGAVLAIRTECPRLLRWGGKILSCGEWVSV
jgi:hypothetical protein